MLNTFTTCRMWSMLSKNKDSYKLTEVKLELCGNIGTVRGIPSLLTLWQYIPQLYSSTPSHRSGPTPSGDYNFYITAAHLKENTCVFIYLFEHSCRICCVIEKISVIHQGFQKWGLAGPWF